MKVMTMTIESLKPHQQRRIDDGHSVPLEEWDSEGRRLYIHYPYLHPIGAHGAMKCTFDFFEAVWAGSE